MPKAAAHEQFDRLPAAHTLSDRAFGLAITLALTLFGLSPMRHGAGPRLWAVGAAAMLLIVALVRPSLLHSMAAIWAKVVRPVNVAVTWVTMSLLFAVVIVPVGLGRRLLVKDPLQLRKDPEAPSYWKARNSAGSAGSMINQF